MKNILLLSLATFCLIQADAQKWDQATVTDQRDSSTYKIIKIGSIFWLAENLKYQTQKSITISIPGLKHNETFYSFKDLKNVCPRDWRIPNLGDWKLTYKKIAENLQVENEFWAKDSIPMSADVNLLHDNNILNLKPIGWVQNGELDNNGKLTTIWINGPWNIARGHLHLRLNSFSLHTHKHDLRGKMIKQRYFSVRCVKNE